MKPIWPFRRRWRETGVFQSPVRAITCWWRNIRGSGSRTILMTPAGQTPASIIRARRGGSATAVHSGSSFPERFRPWKRHCSDSPQIARAENISPVPDFLKGKSDYVIPANSRVSILFDHSYLTTGYPELKLSRGENSIIRLTYAEALWDAEHRKGNRNEIENKSIEGYQDIFVADGGEKRVFRPLWQRTLRYIQLNIETSNEPLTLHDLIVKFVAYPFEEQASFVSDDESLKPIWDVGWRTARLCAGEIYFDCPYYEQMQYAGDTRIQALISLYVSGDDRLMRKAIHQFDNSRIPDGLTTSRYPSYVPQIIPPYSLFWIAMIHDYWRHRDDAEFVRSFLPSIRTVIEWFERHLDDTGMLGPLPWWNFVDWAPEFKSGVPKGAAEGHSSILTLTFTYGLQYAEELAPSVRKRRRRGSLSRAGGRHAAGNPNALLGFGARHAGGYAG